VRIQPGVNKMKIEFPITVTIEVNDFTNPFFTLDEQIKIKELLIKNINNAVNDWDGILEYVQEQISPHELKNIEVSDYEN
jgi:hypothetical protein